MKVRCGVCSNEKVGFCSIKKTRIKPNKSRKCTAYVYDESKVKTRQSIPSIKFGYNEHREQKQLMKEERNALKVAKKQLSLDSTFDEQSAADFAGNQKHPLTGDLSRFTTTAVKNEE